MSSLDESLGDYLSQVGASKQRQLEYIRREQAAHTRAFNYIDTVFRGRVGMIEGKLSPHLTFRTYPPITKGVEVVYKIDLIADDGVDFWGVEFRLNGDTGTVIWGATKASFEDVSNTDVIEQVFATTLRLRAQHLKGRDPNDPEDEHG